MEYRFKQCESRVILHHHYKIKMINNFYIRLRKSHKGWDSEDSIFKTTTRRFLKKVKSHSNVNSNTNVKTHSNLNLNTNTIFGR
jgi:hypothetical protein